MLDKLKKLYEKIIKIVKYRNQVQKLDSMNYEKIITLMKEKGTFDDFQIQLNSLDEIEELMQIKTNLHGINHIARVIFNCYAIMALENVNKEDMKIVIEAVKLHDIGRSNDGIDANHGAKSAEKAKKILKQKGFTTEEINAICFIITEHSLHESKNVEDIEKLPEKVREKYRYYLNLLKDADKLDRVRIGDLDPNRLALDSSKRLVQVAKDIFENNTIYYKKKIKMYEFDENNTKQLYEKIKEFDTSISEENLKKNYSKYKAIEEQGKLEWLKSRDSSVPLDDYADIITILSNKDKEYLRDKFLINEATIVRAIYDMGIDKFMQLKTSNKLDKFMNINNYTKIVETLTQEEKDLLIKLRTVDYGNQVIDYFYLYYKAIKQFDSNKMNALILNSDDKYDYFNKRIEDKNTGYRWIEDLMFVSAPYEINTINMLMDNKVWLDIREKLNIPLNIIITAVLHLGLDKETVSNFEREDLEKLLLNYYKLNLNVNVKVNEKQVTRLLLSLPQEIDKDCETVIKESLVGRLKRFGLDNFEQIKNYKKICDEKIIQEFENSDDVNKLRNLILETKVYNLEGIKRDIYFYKKYMSKDNEVLDLFEELFNSKDKQQLFSAYQKLNGMKKEFDLDFTLNEIRKEMSQISKEDVVKQMNLMQEKIEDASTKKINGNEVIDLTGTNFNLLVSVIGSYVSPYLTKYYNNLIRRTAEYRDKKILFPILRAKTNLHMKLGIKKLVNKRYKIDPLKNKQRCVSSIDEDYLGHIKSESYINDKQTKEKLILSYFPESKENVYYMGNQDLMTIYDKERNDPTRKRVPHEDNLNRLCNLKLKDLNNTTIGEDNELVIDSYPGAVLCFDTISNISTKTAKKLNIPILYIDTKEQFKIMQKKLNEYYKQAYKQILDESQMSKQTFERIFHSYDLDNNIIHRAFKLASSLGYLDTDEYPRDEIAQVFSKMAIIVTESIKRCNDEQKREIRKIMMLEANQENHNYLNFEELSINLKDLKKLVLEENETNMNERE